MIRQRELPELLSPAGSPEALHAAVSAGADAVYFGAQNFNARKYAANFTAEELSEAIRYCRCFGVKTHIVLNTQLYTKELDEALKTAEALITAGADAFIVADLGLATLLHRYFPDISLHASTQACGQNAMSAEMLAAIGFSRMVAARELPLADLRQLCPKSPIETEIFVHGALCVCHSGQCLMSAVIGGRSGNRGECAQPCRLPYRTENPYPLSLKDLCLASYIPEIIETGVDSLKIEGRMKSPAYVAGVTAVYRRLLNEKRAATPKEVESLAALFSRSGFTDGYFTEKISRRMLGVRTEADKNLTNDLVQEKNAERTLPLYLIGTFAPNKEAFLHGEVIRDGVVYSTDIKGAIGAEPTGAGTSPERIRENLAKLGGTHFAAVKVTLNGSPVFLPLSEINRMRRDLCEALQKELVGTFPAHRDVSYRPSAVRAAVSHDKSAYFSRFSLLTDKVYAYYDRIFLPVSEYLENIDFLRQKQNVGISLPPVCFEREAEGIRLSVGEAKKAGCRMALISGLWQARMAAEAGFSLHGDLRLNVFNAESLSLYHSLGFSSALVSPEIGMPAAEAMAAFIPRGMVIYGRLPLMTLEKCIIRDTIPQECERRDCTYCDRHPFLLTDRTGASFPVFREEPHRNVLYNSVPVYMADKPPHTLFTHCIFTDESPEKVDGIIDAIEKRLPPQGKFKRL